MFTVIVHKQDNVSPSTPVYARAGEKQFREITTVSLEVHCNFVQLVIVKLENFWYPKRPKKGRH